MATHTKLGGKSFMETSMVDRQTRRRTRRLCRAEKRPPRAKRMADALNKGQISGETKPLSCLELATQLKNGRKTNPIFSVAAVSDRCLPKNKPNFGLTPPNWESMSASVLRLSLVTGHLSLFLSVNMNCLISLRRFSVSATCRRCRRSYSANCSSARCLSLVRTKA